MHQGSRLKWLIDNSPKSRRDIALEAGISEASIYNYQNEETINSKKLKKLAAALGVDMSEFDEKQVMNEPTADYRVLQERVRSLEQMIHDKEVIIINQQEIIELLKKGKPKTK